MDVLSKFVESFLVALAPVLASLVVAWVSLQVKAMWAKFKEKNPEISYYLEQAAQMAVIAAEQANLSGLAIEKKEYALAIAEKYLEETLGLQIDLDLIAAAIEAEVFKRHAEFAETARLKAVE